MTNISNALPVTDIDLLTEYDTRTGPYVTSSKFDRNLYSWTDVKNVNPYHRFQIEKRLDASTAYAISSVTAKPALIRGSTYTTGFYCCGHFKSSRRLFIGYKFAPPIPAFGDTVLRDQALSKVKSRLNDFQQNFDVLVPIAEIRDLRRTVRDAADLSLDFVQRVTPYIGRRSGKVLRTVSKAWLNYSFGMAPLMRDAADLTDAIQTSLDHPRMGTFSGVASKTWLTSAGSQEPAAPFGARWYLGWRQTHTLSYKYGVGALSLTRSANSYDRSSHLGLDIGELIPAAWEVVPFSFIMDYFSTVGDYLDDTFSVDAANTVFCYLNTKYKMVATSSALQVIVDPYSRQTEFSQSPGYIEYNAFSRTKLGSLPRRSFRFKTVDEIGRNSVNKLLNLVSLLGSRR